MHPRGQAAALSLIAFVLLAGFIAGCGGSGSGSQGDGAAKKEAPQTKIAIGTIKTVKPDKRRVVLRPNKQVQGSEKIAFNVRKNAKIDLDGKNVEMGDISEDQQAQIEYVVKNDVNRALKVHLFKASEQKPSGGGEATG